MEIYKDEFNRLRCLVNVGAQLELVIPRLSEEERTEVEDHFSAGDMAWLKKYIAILRRY
jgi:hypothetical protein